jgi:hypothetical protein
MLLQEVWAEMTVEMMTTTMTIPTTHLFHDEVIFRDHQDLSETITTVHHHHHTIQEEAVEIHSVGSTEEDHHKEVDQEQVAEAAVEGMETRRD